MRVQGSNAYTWVRDAPDSEGVVGQLKLPQNPIFGDVITGNSERAVGSKVDHPQGPRHEYGGHIRGAREFLKKLHVADGSVAGQAGGLLVHGSGGQGIHPALHRQLTCPGDPFHGRLAAGGRDLPDGHVARVQVVDVQHVHRPRRTSRLHRRLHLPYVQRGPGESHRLLHGPGAAYDHWAADGVYFARGQGLYDDLGADAAGITHGDSDNRFAVLSHAAPPRLAR